MAQAAGNTGTSMSSHTNNAGMEFHSEKTAMRERNHDRKDWKEARGTVAVLDGSTHTEEKNAGARKEDKTYGMNAEKEQLLAVQKAEKKDSENANISTHGPVLMGTEANHEKPGEKHANLQANEMVNENADEGSLLNSEQDRHESAEPQTAEKIGDKENAIAENTDREPAGKEERKETATAENEGEKKAEEKNIAVQGNTEELQTSITSGKTKPSPAAGMEWKPVVNLSPLDEFMYRRLEELSEYITFLPCEEEGVLRYEYPVVCNNEDAGENGDVWLSILHRLSKGGYKHGHSRIKPGKSVFMQMSCAAKCHFAGCPYVIAAYIRYLKEFDPNELERQRNVYHANRFTGIKEVPSVIPYHMDGSSVTKEELDKGLKCFDSGRFAISMSWPEEIVEVSWRKQARGKEEQLLHARIRKEELEKKAFRADNVRAEDGSTLPRGIALAILVQYLLKTNQFQAIYENAVTQEERAKEITDILGALSAHRNAISMEDLMTLRNMRDKYAEEEQEKTGSKEEENRERKIG